ncbi:protein-disulfide reductase DsbD domain-containing protein [Roseateles terrae]|uniref:DsbC/DsbD-like thiol-disulfide interchange protein n=1 Tax=Roseateles terrae TaxID=431060 RepID=A0ABR6GZZ0_9BURK|nr:protein-disulfide reductase DsbD domain-containing protein [Roseateles terrae]MBB3196799.1 DsbC/DsbD-like thiol-disulfide interchange protein [Roseateles terrae]
MSASRAVQPGQTVLLGLEQRIAPHWHTYWRNPGDSGQPTSIQWTLPKGAQAGDILWPAPKRFDVGPITNYGYENQTLLLTELKLPPSLKSGSSVRLQAEVNWLVCQDSCIPQQATLTLTLPVAAQAVPSPDAPALASAKQALPAPAPMKVEASLQNQDLLIRWPAQALGAGAPDPDKTLFLPQDWGRIQHAAKPQLTQADGAWQLRMPVGEQPARAGQVLEGLLLVHGQAWSVSTMVEGIGGAAGAGGGAGGAVADKAQGAEAIATGQAQRCSGLALRRSRLAQSVGCHRPGAGRRSHPQPDALRLPGARHQGAEFSAR